MLIEAGGREDVALACALLSERHALPSHPASTISDLLAAVDDPRAVAPHVREVARRLVQAARESRETTRAGARDERGFLRAVFAGYPDRVARRRSAGSPRFLLASGHGAVLGRESGVRDAEFVVAVDVQAGRRGDAAEARIRLASAIDPEWLLVVRGLREVRIVHEFDERQGRVRATEREYYGAIVVSERPASIDHDLAAEMLAGAYRARGLTEDDARLLRRLRFAGIDVDPAALVAAAAAGRQSLGEMDLCAAWDTLRHAGGGAGRDLDRLAPERLPLPSGRTASLRYEEDGSVVAAVKLQELFGLADSPRLGPRQTPVTFELLAPNGHPVQTTRDLRSFWNTTYIDVRRQLRGRYPKHPWPEDPWTAPPTARANRRRQAGH